MRSLRTLLLVALSICIAACDTADDDSGRMLDHPVFNEAFIPGYSVEVDGERFAFEAKQVGQFRLSAGSLMACDPFTCATMNPFVKKLPAGEFPLSIAIAKSEKDERIALAKISFSSKPIHRWELALTKGQYPAALRDGEVFCYGVDTGTGSFMDADALAEYRLRLRDERFSERLIEEMERTGALTRASLLLNDMRGSVALFSSGYGDGCYATYFAYDAEGALVAAITDFFVIPWRSQRN